LPLVAVSDCGNLGPGSDISVGAGSFASRPNAGWFALLAALVAGVLLALAAGHQTGSHVTWSHFGGLFHTLPAEASAPRPSPMQLDNMQPQKQAEALLELAVAQDGAAVEQISSRLERWHGKLNWNPQIATLTTAALNSNDLRVRESGIEVELAAYGLEKNSSSVEYILRTAQAPDHARKVWALWALGLMANRGVEPERLIAALKMHLQDSDEDSRHWAVEGLALSAGDDAIPLLLTAMRDDPSRVVREEAACGLAQSGMFSREQRLSAVPQLLAYSDDPALDAQTHAWAFQALAEITGEHLPNDSAAWRKWYESRN
jgi:hypothetical protein